MAIFDTFPYTNFHELNLDWIIKMLRQYADTLEYVQTFDVTGEVSAKLEEMLADGELTNLLGDFPARLTAAENSIDDLVAKTTWNGSAQSIADVTCPPEVETNLIDHVVTSGQAGRLLVLAYGAPQQSHDAIYNLTLSAWRNGEAYAIRTVRENQYSGGGVINYQVLDTQAGDHIYLRVTQRYADASVPFRGYLNTIKLFD